MEQKKVSEKNVSRGGRRPNAGRKAPNGRQDVDIHFKVTRDFREKFNKLAQNEGLTLSDFFRLLVTQYEQGGGSR